MKKIIIVILIILVIMAIVSTIILINTKNRDIKGNNDFIENLIQENKIENTSYAINEINEIVQNSINEKKNEILEKDIKPVDDFSSTTNVKQDLSKIQDKSTNFKDSKTPIKNEQTKKENMSKDNIKVDEDKETNKTSTTQNLAKKSIKKLKETSKATVKGTKAIVSSVKTLITLIIAGGWISVIIILIICLFGGVLALFNSNGDDDTEELWKSDIVAVAQSQIGVTGGEPYWSWYGFDERVEWCACFVSWCANQCGYIEKGVIPKFSACTDGITWFKEKNEWKDRSDSYYPIKGDIIFFDWKEGNGEQDGVSDHVGIVSKIDINTNTIYTVEGNSGDACKERNYLFDDVEIMGYGTPKY